MMKEMMKAIREFAEENWAKDEAEQIYGNDDEFAVSNPWIDYSGRFPLTDEQAVKEWGLDVVMDFCEKAKRKINSAEGRVLCGFVYCHGNKDFSCWEVGLPETVNTQIQEILSKFELDGTSERNVWDMKFSDVLSEEY